jgi:parallel beta-helix repeat protein
LGLDTDYNVVVGNYIGTDAAGTGALGNTFAGVFIADGASHNLIGRDSSGEGNLISGNADYGVYIEDADTTNNTISGNVVGMDVTGTTPLGNAATGVYILGGASQNTIDFGNTIITDFDLGAGTVTGIACSGCTVEIFSDSEDEGEVYEGQAMADGAGDFTFSKGAALAGPHVTATATDSAGNTSEFGSRVSVPADFDFDGDGDSDVGVYRPSAGRWFIQGQPIVTFGASNDIPVAGDYDGDGDTDIALFRPSSGRWFILGQPMVAYGASGDIPVEKRPTYAGYPY